ncbi:MAG TPA: small ribosomal subunit Rsm22 family protein [Spirochaetales bacterium]|nr:small ribosomal subunit Rsm22 family protein [Spirochaetales bacterium]
MKNYLPLLLDIANESGKPFSPHKKGEAGLSREEIYRISREVQRISMGLTGERALAGVPYLEDSYSLGAYLLYYWPISYAAATALLRPIVSSWISSEHTPKQALDLGAGGGPVSFTLLDQGIASVTACDRSPKALQVLQELSRRRKARLKTIFIDLETAEPVFPGSGPFHLITLGNLLNELWKGAPDRIFRRFRLVQSLIPLLAPEGKIVILEPALSQTSQELLKVRDLLTQEGKLGVEQPCFFQNPCPALPEGSCHTEIPWNPPSLVREIGRRARITDRTSVKFSYLVLSSEAASHSARESFPASQTPEGLTHRVVSDPLLSKSGKIRYLVCGPLGRFALSAKRHSIKHSSSKEGSLNSALKTFLSLKRGDVIQFWNLEPRENGYGLLPESKLTILHREGSVRKTLR